VRNHLLAAIFGLLSVAALSGCGTLAPHQADGALGKQFTAIIPGTWAQSIHHSNNRFDMTKTYYPDGSAKGVLRWSQDHGRVSFIMPTVSFKSRWKVTGDIVETYAIKCSYPGMFDPKEVIRDRLLSVNHDRVDSSAIVDGQHEVLTRIR
jgi:hypothetical protein